MNDHKIKFLKGHLVVFKNQRDRLFHGQIEVVYPTISEAVVKIWSTAHKTPTHQEMKVDLDWMTMWNIHEHGGWTGPANQAHLHVEQTWPFIIPEDRVVTKDGKHGVVTRIEPRPMEVGGEPCGHHPYDATVELCLGTAPQSDKEEISGYMLEGLSYWLSHEHGSWKGPDKKVQVHPESQMESMNAKARRPNMQNVDVVPTEVGEKIHMDYDRLELAVAHGVASAFEGAVRAIDALVECQHIQFEVARQLSFGSGRGSLEIVQTIVELALYHRSLPRSERMETDFKALYDRKAVEKSVTDDSVSENVPYRAMLLHSLVEMRDQIGGDMSDGDLEAELDAALAGKREFKLYAIAAGDRTVGVDMGSSEAAEKVDESVGEPNANGDLFTEEVLKQAAEDFAPGDTEIVHNPLRGIPDKHVVFDEDPTGGSERVFGPSPLQEKMIEEMDKCPNCGRSMKAVGVICDAKGKRCVRCK